MKLITKTPVQYNNGLTGQQTGIVIGELMNCNQQTINGLVYNFLYEYKTEDGKNLISDIYSITSEDINSLYNQVSGLVPSELSYTESTQYLYYLGMKVKMAEIFGIEMDNIEII